MTTQVILLRAVNVGGSVLRMAQFRAAIAQAGGTSITTIGASGNAVAEVKAGTSEETFARAIERALSRNSDPKVEVFTRTGAAWEEIVRANPFPQQAETDPAHLVVTVLAGSPPRESWGRLRAAIVGRESVAAGDRHAYIVYPDGIGRSKLTPQLIERQLGVRGTSRNWNTVRALERLLQP